MSLPLSLKMQKSGRVFILFFARQKNTKRIHMILFLTAPNLVSKGRWIFYAASTGTLWGNEKLFIKLIRSRKHKMYNNFRYGKFELVTSFCMRWSLLSLYVSDSWYTGKSAMLQTGGHYILDLFYQLQNSHNFTDIISNMWIGQ